MKIFLAIGFILVGYFSGVMDATAQVDNKFEVVPNCMYTKSHARCFVSNKTDDTVRCKIKVTGYHHKVPVYSHYSLVPIKPHHFTEIDLYSEGKFTSVDGYATCGKE